MKNKEKKFGQLGSEEDPVITITKEQVRDYFGTLEHIQTSPLRLQGHWPADTPAQNCWELGRGQDQFKKTKQKQENKQKNPVSWKKGASVFTSRVNEICPQVLLVWGLTCWKKWRVCHRIWRSQGRRSAGSRHCCGTGRELNVIRQIDVKWQSFMKMKWPLGFDISLVQYLQTLKSTRMKVEPLRYLLLWL